MLKICDHGHITGYKTCMTCGSESIRPLGLYRVTDGQAETKERMAAKRDARTFVKLLDRLTHVANNRRLYRVWRMIHKARTARKAKEWSRRPDRGIFRAK